MAFTAQHALIVSGSTGIGLATAVRFVAGGARVTVTGRSEGPLHEAQTRLGPAACARALDARQEAELRTLLDGIEPIDHLVLTVNSGAAVGPFVEIDQARFRAAFDNKFWPYVNTIRLAAPKLRRGGSVTLVTGAAARRAVPNMAGLAATNGALNALVGPLALELAPVRVNAVCPGVVESPYWDTVPQAQRDAMFKRAAEQVPLKRVADADDIADAVLFLAGNPNMTGALIDCDAGIRLV